MPADQVNAAPVAQNVMGDIPRFNHATNNFDVFRAQLQQFFVANQVLDETRKKALLLTALSENTYLLLINLLNPLLPDSTSVSSASCLSVLEEHFKPPKASFMERHNFYMAVKQPAESVHDWEARVKALAVNCEFGSMLETALRDKFVMGLEKGPAREKIFLEGVNITLKRAVEIAVAAEYIEHQVKDEASIDNCLHISRGNSCKKKNQHQQRQQKQKQQQTSSKYQQHQQQQEQPFQCSVCGYNNHTSNKCKFKNYKCNKCHRRGHLKKMCKEEAVYHFENEDNSLKLFSLQASNEDPIKVEVEILKRLFVMELDTGSQHCVMPLNIFKDNFNSNELTDTNLVLKTYTGAVMKPVGTIRVEVKFNNKCKVIPFVVVRESGPMLLGRKFLEVFKIKLSNVDYNEVVDEQDAIKRVKAKFPQLFDGHLGCFKKGEAHLVLKDNSKPKFFKPRPVPLAIQEKVEKEINKLVHMNVLEPLEFSEWATPIVPILKKNGEVRICGDYKVTINPNIETEKFPLPKIEDIFARLYEGVEFTKLDLSMAYQQIKLDSESSKLTTISTTKGLFKYKRLIYGLSSAPAIFQRIMETLLVGLEGVAVFLDDILITAPNRKLHEERVDKVLGKLQDAGFTLASDKCNFFCKQIEYLGHIIDAKGLRANKNKVEFIESIPYPSSVKEVQAFLGVVNFYRRFIPNAATIGSPLYELLKPSKRFKWTVECSRAIDTFKEILKSEACLAHFNPNMKTKLTVDASPIGVAAVLSQVDTKGNERAIEFASRTLSTTEKKYSQLDKEALAILFGVRKFYHYLYARHFTLVTDNKPLQHIFNPQKGIPMVAANRLQRIALTLSAFDFDIVHVKSGNNVADYFSRYLVSTKTDLESGQEELPDCVYLNYVIESNKLNLDINRVREETRKDETLQKVIDWVKGQWPKTVLGDQLIPFVNRKLELSEDQGCLFWGYRVVIPKKLQAEVLNSLHATHMGIVKMKCMARECCWWPTQNHDIEEVTKKCEACLLTRPDPPKQKLNTWTWPTYPWDRIHIDFFGPFLNKMFLIVIDSHSKWIECIDMGQNITSSATIMKLKEMFARFGLPSCVVSDNGTSFVSEEFKMFLGKNGIKHITTPVGNPASNGQAENAVKTVKAALKRCLHASDTSQINDKLYRFLIDYRNTVHGTTGVAPACLMFNRQIKTRLDLLNPKRKIESNMKNVKLEVEHKQNKQKKNFRGKKTDNFSVGDSVMAKDYSKPGKITWHKSKIIKKIGQQVYIVKPLKSEKKWKRHANQLVICNLPDNGTTHVSKSWILSNPLEKLPTIDKQNDVVNVNSSPLVHRYNLRSRKNTVT